MIESQGEGSGNRLCLGFACVGGYGPLVCRNRDLEEGREVVYLDDPSQIGASSEQEREAIA